MHREPGQQQTRCWFISAWGVGPGALAFPGNSDDRPSEVTSGSSLCPGTPALGSLRSIHAAFSFTAPTPLLSRKASILRTMRGTLGNPCSYLQNSFWQFLRVLSSGSGSGSGSVFSRDGAIGQLRPLALTTVTHLPGDWPPRSAFWVRHTTPSNPPLIHPDPHGPTTWHAPTTRQEHRASQPVAVFSAEDRLGTRTGTTATSRLQLPPRRAPEGSAAWPDRGAGVW